MKQVYSTDEVKEIVSSVYGYPVKGVKKHNSQWYNEISRILSAGTTTRVWTFTPGESGTNLVSINSPLYFGEYYFMFQFPASVTLAAAYDFSLNISLANLYTPGALHLDSMVIWDVKDTFHVAVVNLPIYGQQPFTGLFSSTSMVLTTNAAGQFDYKTWQWFDGFQVSIS